MTGAKQRLKYQKPIKRLAQKLISGKFDTNTKRNDGWKISYFNKPNLIVNSIDRFPNLPNWDCVLLNMLRTGHGRTEHMLHKQRLKQSSEYDCGYEKPTATHVVEA